jgi:hypothetical protein
LINVTQVDIKKGTVDRTDVCPIARAMRRHKPLKNAHVGRSSFSPSGLWNDELPLPEKAVVFTRDFDSRPDRRQLPPFSFSVKIPDEILYPPPKDG